MTTAQVSNSSFRAALEKVLDGERVLLATAIAKLRMGGSLAGAVAIAILSLTGQWRSFSASMISSAMHLVLSVVIWRLLVTGKLVKSAGWIVPLFDVPIVAVAQVIQTPHLPSPLMGMVNTPAMMLAFMVVSLMSLSRRVIVLTSLIGVVPILYRAWFVSLSPGVLALTLMSWAIIALALLTIVGRMRGLVHTSRAQDLLGKYVLGKRIGLGGMAEVFEATTRPRAASSAGWR